MNTSKPLLILVFLTLASGAGAMDLPYVNWENHAVHPLDLSPDQTTLAVAHTADNRVQLFDVSGGEPRRIGHIPVGVDPVSVRFRTNDELWAVNHISDSVTVIDLGSRRVKATLLTADEPYDVVFAGNPERAFVSCSQANKVQVFEPAALNQAPIDIQIEAEDPRAMAVSPGGETVYVAIFESGNASTILAGNGSMDPDPRPIILFPETPHGGAAPPPNDGDQFVPPINPELPNPRRSGLIVKKDAEGRWMDDNNGDWTDWVGGELAEESSRVPGWDMPDRDIAVIDAQSLQVSYAASLMNIGMSLAVNPGDGRVTLVGTEATNQIRFEPNLSGRFLRVLFAAVDPVDLDDSAIVDLNPHLDYQSSQVPRSERNRSIGDPRGIVWTADGSRGFVAGMGSNSVIVINPDGSRVAGSSPIEVGEGPIGLALDEGTNRLFVWNQFDASLTTVGLVGHNVKGTTSVFSPLPNAIKKGRKHFYDTHETSGLGQAACASCHVDGRMDRLAWDLGDPSGEVKAFNQNCGSNQIPGGNCQSFHPMKGPMVTQTLQDIIGKEPFHWRGDRDGLEEFNGAFLSLMGDDETLSSVEMQQFENFLATIYYPPNPFRNLDNSLSGKVALPGHVSNGRFADPGSPLPNGNANRGLTLFRGGSLVDVGGNNNPGVDLTNCTVCHDLPTGMAPNGRHFDPFVRNIFLGGQLIPPGPNGENHLLVTAMSTGQSLTMKIPSLRNLYERVGFVTKLQDSAAGFGFLHDGTIDSLAHFVELSIFRVMSNQDVADLVAFFLSFSGSDLPTENAAFEGATIVSKDTHAAVGQQVTRTNSNATGTLNTLVNLAASGRIDLVAHRPEGLRHKGWSYNRGAQTFTPDDGGPALNLNGLLSLASNQRPVTFTAVPTGLGTRLGLDRDGDGIYDGVEIARYSNPADAESTTFSPEPGLWFNPDRSGHGVDLQRSGDALVATWYTYREDGSPHWYQAFGEFQGMSWTGELYQAVWVPAQNGIEIQVVGTMTMDFSSSQSAEFSWQIGEHSGQEPFTRLTFAVGYTPQNYTGLWYDPGESGWGISVDSLADTRAALVYFYDADNNPRWVLGSGGNASGTELEMLSFTGFCPWCETVEAQPVDGGSLTMFFDGNRAAMADFAVDYPEIPGSVFSRTTEVVPLSNEDLKPIDF